MGFEQLAALRDQLAAEAAKNKRPARKPSSRKDEASHPSQAGKPAQEKAQRKAQNKNRTAQKPRREPQPQVEPVVLNISRLQRQYPKAFPKRPDPKVPLKLGIHNDLYAQSETLGLTQEEIKEAIQTWCQGSRYWSCLVLDAPRIDLSGEVVGVVTEAEAKRAKQLASRQRWQARNAQKKAAKEVKTPAANAKTPAEPCVETKAGAETTAEQAVEQTPAPLVAGTAPFASGQECIAAVSETQPATSDNAAAPDFLPEQESDTPQGS